MSRINLRIPIADSDRYFQASFDQMLGRRSNVAKKPRDVVQLLDTSLRIKNMRHFASVALQPINSIQPIRVLSISPWNSW